MNILNISNARQSHQTRTTYVQFFIHPDQAWVRLDIKADLL